MATYKMLQREQHTRGIEFAEDWEFHYQYEQNKNLTLLRIISGAKYSGVPQSVHVLPLTRLPKPKSVT